MAIRKFRKSLKPFIWIITVLFVMSSAFLYYGQIKNSNSGPKGYAFKLNGEEIPKIGIERLKSNIGSSYTQSLGVQIDPTLLGVIAIDEEINKFLTLKLADKLKVKVSSSEISEEYDKIKNSVGDEEKFKRILSAQGLTRDMLKKEIEENQKIGKLFEALQSGAVVTDEELLKYYNENSFSKFRGVSFDTSKEEIKKSLVQEKAVEQYSVELEKLRKDLKIEGVQEEYKADLPVVEKEIEGFKFTNADIARKTLSNIAQKGVTLEEGKKLSYEQIDNQMKLVKKSIEKGVKVEESLPSDLKIIAYSKGLLDVLREETKVDDKELEKFFNENKDKYDRAATVDANVAILEIEPSDKDKEATKIKSQEILKTVNKDNFAEMAKSNSKDTGSAINGGDLGWFTKDMMVAPFAEASFKGKVGEIYPEIVETEFGYHIIFVKDKKQEDGKEQVNAAHILLMPEVSEDTKTLKKDEINKIVTDLNAKTVEFEKLKETNKNIVYAGKVDKIPMDGYIQGIGYEENLAKALFNSKSEEYFAYGDSKREYIVKKLGQNEAYDAKLSDKEIYDKVINDYKTKSALEEIEKIITK